jgi:hypothetical protein
MSLWTKTSGAVVLASFAFGGAALGGEVNDSFWMMWDSSNDAVGEDIYDPADFGEVIEYADGRRQYIGTRIGTDAFGQPAWELDWDCMVDPDPFVDAAIQVTNISGVDATFSLLMVLPIIPTGPMTEMNGSAALTLTNNGFESAFMRPEAGDSIYSAYIDFVSVADVPQATLFGGAYELSAGAFTTVDDDDDFGNPSPLSGPPAGSNIAIRLTFELSAGDSASISSLFNIVAVPAPAGLAVLGLIGLAATRRRRS